MIESTDLPRGWALIPLRDLGEWSGGGTPSKRVSSFWTGGAIPWVSPKDMKVPVISDSIDHITDDAVRASAAKLIPPGSVLVVTRSGILAHTLPVARTAVAVTVNQDIKALTPTPSFVPDFIAWGARAFGWTILNACSKDGTTVPSVDTTLLQDFRLPVAPNAEQRRIVEAIESYFTRLDDAVATLERVQRNLKRYRASVLKAAVEGRLVPTEAELARAEVRDYEPASVLLERILTERRRHWEEAELAKLKAKGKPPKDDKWKAKYKEPVAADTNGLPELPDGWCWTTVEQLGFIASGQTPKGVTTAGAQQGDVPWFRVGDMNADANQFHMTVATEWLTTAQVAALGLHVRPTGTIVFPKRGGAITTNKKRLLGRPAAYDLNMMGVVPIGDVRYYLWVWFLGVDLGSLADGSNVPQINHGDIAPLPVPLPPAAEQDRIVNYVNTNLSIADDVSAAVTANRLRSSRLRQSILKWAFEGRLVDQDPTDEPASRLLERIRAELAAMPARPERAQRRVRATTEDRS